MCGLSTEAPPSLLLPAPVTMDSPWRRDPSCQYLHSRSSRAAKTAAEAMGRLRPWRSTSSQPLEGRQRPAKPSRCASLKDGVGGQVRAREREEGRESQTSRGERAVVWTDGPEGLKAEEKKAIGVVEGVDGGAEGVPLLALFRVGQGPKVSPVQGRDPGARPSTGLDYLRHGGQGQHPACR